VGAMPPRIFGLEPPLFIKDDAISKIHHLVKGNNATMSMQTFPGNAFNRFYLTL